jgi:hypothetical protein
MAIRWRAGVAGLASLSVLVLPSQALAAEGDSGSGSGGGGGGGGGGETTGSVYSDLVLALRATNGTPILKKYDVPATTESDATTEYCVQPVSYTAVPGTTETTNPVNGQSVWVIPLQGEWLPGEAREDDPNALAPDELGACDPIPAYAGFVSEVELERLNLARTDEKVIAQKVADVQTKLQFADVITLESTGRLVWDGTPIDASPENAGIYQSLMKTGTIPGLHPSSMAGPPAQVGPAPADGSSNSQFDTWELAAMAIGAAASKSVPINVDTIEYYNRVIGLPDFSPLWSGVHLVQPQDPGNPGSTLATGEKFVDYSGFTYNRSQTFKGSVTWLDIPTLTWKVSHLTDVVPFTHPEIGTQTLTGVKAFAQLADDVRALCNFIPDNTYIPGFSMDVPGVDTYDKQLKATRDPAVGFGTLPETVFKTYPFQITASLLNPWAGTQIDDARLRLTIHAPAGFEAGDVTATAAAPDGQAVPFDVGAGGDLVGWWGPSTGFPVAPGYNVSTTFDVTVADTAPSGTYDLTLDLVKASDPSASLAQVSGSLTVNDNAATVLWASAPPKLVVQASTFQLPVTVYSPDAGEGDLTLTFTGPGDDPTTDLVEETKQGDITVYASNGSDMVAMPLTLDAQGRLTGTWHTTLAAGYNPMAWYATVIDGAVVGNYQIDVSLAGANAVDPAVIAVAAPEDHGQKPPDAGDDTTAPEVTIAVVGTLSSTATFTIVSDDSSATYACRLVTNDVPGAWESCGGTKSYSGLTPGSYAFEVKATDSAGNSATYRRAWVLQATPDQQQLVPNTGVVRGPADHGWLLSHRAVFQVSSTKSGSAYAVTLNGRYQGTTSSSTVVVKGLKAGANRITIRAIANGYADTSPVSRDVLVPRGVSSIGHTRSWKVRHGSGTLFGSYAQTRRFGQTFEVRSAQIKRVALVVSEGAGYGKVRVFLNGRPISGAIRLGSTGSQSSVLVPVRTFSTARHGVLTVKVVSHGKVVRLEGIGVSAR